MGIQELIIMAKEALKNSYAPYSNFTVASVVEMKDGHTFLGVNVENGSYGATNCAERSAIFSAISNGYKKGDFKTIVVITHLDQVVPPCGVCRQVMCEFFDEETQIIIAQNSGKYQTYSLNDIMPLQFELESNV